jgi:hypothetical protein
MHGAVVSRPDETEVGVTAVAVSDQGVPSTPGGVRWLAFAAALLAVSGVFKILDALWAFKYDDDRSDEVQTVLFEGDLTSWGWVWLVVGVVLIATGFAVVTGAEWARWVGIVAASVATITFLPWIYYQPLWTVLSVTLAVLVIYALVAHGGSRSPMVRGYD